MRFCWWFILVSGKQACWRSTSKLIGDKVQSRENKKRTMVFIKPPEIWKPVVTFAKKSSFLDESIVKSKTSRLKLKIKTWNLIFKEFEQWAWVKNDILIQKYSTVSWWRSIRSIRSLKDDDLIANSYQTQITLSYSSYFMHWILEICFYC